MYLLKAALFANFKQEFESITLDSIPEALQTHSNGPECIPMSGGIITPFIGH